jgi:hypothetical protein
LLKIASFDLFHTKFSCLIRWPGLIKLLIRVLEGHFCFGQLAPRYEPEVVVEEHSGEVQLEVVVEEDPEEVQQEVEIEEDPKEVQLEVEVEQEPEEHPQLYDGALLDVDADGDMVIPPAPVDAPPPFSASCSH